MGLGGIKRILVTSGAGFLGSHLCDRLIAAEHEVICVDNCYTGTKTNIRRLLDNPMFEFIRHDVTFPPLCGSGRDLESSVPGLTGTLSVRPGSDDQDLGARAINMLGLAKRVKAKILRASTSEVYGDPTVHPQTEAYWGNVNPIGPRSCYDEGKRCAETLFFDYFRQLKLRIKVARIFNTYGPRMHPNDGRVVSNFIVQALRNQPITIFGDGSQTRSFCYVDDLIDGLWRLMNSPDEITGPVNLGNPREFTIRELAEKIISLTGSSSSLVFEPLPQDDPRQRQPDISLARKQLAWEPKIPLEQGLTRTIEYFSAALRNRP